MYTASDEGLFSAATDKCKSGVGAGSNSPCTSLQHRCVNEEPCKPAQEDA